MSRGDEGQLSPQFEGRRLMLIDLNSGSGFIYGAPSACDAGVRINALIDAALEVEHRSKPLRDYLGGSRIGEPCARRLAYEVTLTPVDNGKGFDGRLLRIFDAGHEFEELTIRWLQAAGFDLRTRGHDGQQFAFSVAGGRLRGHIDGVVVTGPDVGIVWPALFEHKALNQSSWTDLVKRGLRQAKPIYFAQVLLYMAYMELEVALFTAMSKNTQELYHEVVPFDPVEAQKLSDKAVDILRAIEAEELPPRIAIGADFHLCRMCPYAQRCWEGEA